MRDPAVESVAGFIGGGRGINNAQMFVAPQAARRAQGVGRRSSPTASARAAARCPARSLLLQRRCRTSASAAASAAAQYQYTLLADDARRAARRGRQRVREALKPLPELTGIDRTNWIASQQVTLDVDREAARQLGIEMRTVDDRRSTTPSASGRSRRIYNALNQYRVVMEVAPQFAQGPEALDQVLRRDRRPAAAVPLSAFSQLRRGRRPTTASATSDQFASESVSFELAPGVSLSQAQAAIDRAVRELTMPTSIQGRLQGNASLFQQSQGNQPLADPRHAADRLHRARRALRELRPPADDPVDAAVGRRRRAAGAAAAQDGVQPRRAARPRSC